MHITEAYRIAELKDAAREEAHGFSSERLRRRFHLSARECEVAHWVAQGKSNPEIGTILNVSRRTVEKHMEHILPKLGVENRTSAAAMLMSITKEKWTNWPEERLPHRGRTTFPQTEAGLDSVVRERPGVKTKTPAVCQRLRA